MNQMLRALNVPVTIRSVDGRSLRRFTKITYYSSDEFPEELVAPERDFHVYEGCPARIIEASDAILPFGSTCLYDHDGVRIDESCVRRRKGLRELVAAGPKCISRPTDFITVDEPVVYLSWLQNHWGHFLTEGTSRLWAFREYPELATLLGIYSCHKLPHKNIRDFVEALPFRIYIGGTRCNRAVRFRKVFVPTASFSNQAEAYSVHHEAALTVTGLYLGEDRPEVSNQPVFLSRSKFGGARSVLNQDELEKAAANLGFLIVHPEDLSLLEQINLFNRHHCFTGCWGSAFHTMVFCRFSKETTTHILCDHFPNLDFLMFDAVLGNEANYIYALPPVPGEYQKWPHLKLAIDVEKAISYFRRAIEL